MSSAFLTQSIRRPLGAHSAESPDRAQANTPAWDLIRESTLKGGEGMPCAIGRLAAPAAACIVKSHGRERSAREDGGRFPVSGRPLERSPTLGRPGRGRSFGRGHLGRPLGGPAARGGRGGNAGGAGGVLG